MNVDEIPPQCRPRLVMVEKVLPREQRRCRMMWTPFFLGGKNPDRVVLRAGAPWKPNVHGPTLSRALHISSCAQGFDQVCPRSYAFRVTRDLLQRSACLSSGVGERSDEFFIAKK